MTAQIFDHAARLRSFEITASAHAGARRRTGAESANSRVRWTRGDLASNNENRRQGNWAACLYGSRAAAAHVSRARPAGDNNNRNRNRRENADAEKCRHRIDDLADGTR